jgi:hypothetical protein
MTVEAWLVKAVEGLVAFATTPGGYCMSINNGGTTPCLEPSVVSLARPAWGGLFIP